MVRHRLTKEEIVRLGKEFYETSVKSRIGPQDSGRFVVVDVQSGDFEVGDDDARATMAMLARRPEAQLYGVRVGDDVAYSIGLGSTGTGP